MVLQAKLGWAWHASCAGVFLIIWLCGFRRLSFTKKFSDHTIKYIFVFRIQFYTVGPMSTHNADVQTQNNLGPYFQVFMIFQCLNDFALEATITLGFRAIFQEFVKF